MGYFVFKNSRNIVCAVSVSCTRWCRLKLAQLAGQVSYRLRAGWLRPGCLSTHHSSEKIHLYRRPLSAQFTETLL